MIDFAYAADAASADSEALAKWLSLTGMSADSVLIVTSPDSDSPQLVSANTQITRYVPPGLTQQALASDKPVFSQLYFHGDQPRVAISRNRLGMHLSDAARAQKPKSYSHRHSPIPGKPR